MFQSINVFKLFSVTVARRANADPEFESYKKLGMHFHSGL